VRAATDANKVGEAVKKYTVDALIGGSPTDDPKLIKKAEKRIKQAKIIFTTCAGAGLGVLRKVAFQTVLIDEASQITEGVALIPLSKGSKRAILVGDQ
jgi:regulator of nonsense transcripts 1